MDIALGFPHEYEIEEVIRGSSLPKIYFPSGSEVGGKDGVLLKIVPTVGKAWLGCFAFGHRRDTGLTRVMSCPNAAEICVIASGAGYIANAVEPSVWSSVRAVPICDVRISQSKGLLIFADFTKLVAYGRDGLKWVSGRVSSDGIQILEVGEDAISVKGWDAATDERVTVRVGLDDGSIR